MTICKYSVLRYIFNEVTDEFVNLGVVVESEGKMECRVPRKYHRIAAYSGISAAELKYIAFDLQARLEGLFTDRDDPRNSLEFIASNWRNAIRVTPPRISSETPGLLLDDLAGEFFGDISDAEATERRGKRYAIEEAAKGFQRAAASFSGLELRLVRKSEAAVAGGSVDQPLFFKMDLALKNGVLRLGGIGMSFESGAPSEIEREIHDITLRIQKIHQVMPSLPIGVIASGMEGLTGAKAKLMDRADQLFTDEDAALIQPQQAEEFADAHLKGNFAFSI